MQGAEIHITSLILQVKPESFAPLCAWLKTKINHTLPFCDRQKNKIIVVIEARTAHDITDAMEHIANQPGVITVSMVYHHVDSEEVDKELL